MFHGERLAELRKDKGLPQKQLAPMLKISVDMLSAYERGVHAPPDQVKDRVVAFFGVSLDYFMGYIDEPIPCHRKTAIDLPKGFPEEAIREVRRQIDLLMLEHKTKAS